MRKLRIYLIGRITGLPDRGEGWRHDYMNEVAREVESAEYHGPYIEYTDADDQFETIKGDIELLRESDVVIVNASIPFMLGGPMELLLAKYFNKPVFTVFTNDSPYYENYFSDYITKSLGELVELIKMLEKDARKINNKTWEEVVR
jgi:hypothetical protein